MIPLSNGLVTKGDKRAKSDDVLEIATNVEFDDLGGLRVRFPFGPKVSNITGGGTLTNCRKLAVLNSELVVFTDTALYSWVPATNSWTYRGDHPAVMTDEQTVFAQTDDQYCCDRAELGGQVVYTWQSATGGVQVAVLDKTDGTVIQPPTQIGAPFVMSTPRLIAMSGCVILLALQNLPAARLVAFKITLSPFAITAPTTIHNIFSTAYDACLVPGRDQIYAVADLGGGSRTYMIASIDSSLTVATTTASNAATTDPQTIAIAVSPDALRCTVVLAGTTVYADIWTVPSTGAPTVRTTTATTLGPGDVTIAHVTAAYRLVQDGGYYRCYAFWSSAEINFAVVNNRRNWIDGSGAVGFATTIAATRFVYGLGVGARAFARDSHVYVIGTFGGLSFSATDPTGTHSQLQNTYYLYRDDGFLIGKAVWGEGGDFHPVGWLPNVTVDANNANRFVVMQELRRIVNVGPNSADAVPSDVAASVYSERAPREVSFTFDDDRARHTVQLGNTLYVTGSIVLQYDGVALTEVGFCTYPWTVNCTPGGAGAIVAAGYSYKATDRWNNAAGEIDRSTTATVSNIVIGSSLKIGVGVVFLYVTRKTGVAIEIWRTKGNPPDGAPFFLVTSQNPALTIGDNAYLLNDPTTNSLTSFSDNEVDATIAVSPAFPENGGTIEPVEPPSASIIVTDAQRLYLAGIPGYPNTVYYSKYRDPGFVASFNDFLSFEVPADGGAITAIDVLDGSLIVWCESATYQYSGPGYNNAGGGSNFQLARVLSTDLGAVSQDALAYYEDGWLTKTGKGWFVLGRNLTYQYVGEGVYKFDSETVQAIDVLTERHQIRILTNARILLLDTLVHQWAEWSVNDGVDAKLVNGTYWYLTPTGPRAELSTWTGYDGSDYTLTTFDIETSWVKPIQGTQQGQAIIDFIQLLGEFRSSCKIRVRIAKDYEAVSPGVWNYHTDKTWTPYPAIAGSAIELRDGLRWNRCASMKVRYTLTHADGVSPLAGPGARFTSLTYQFAIEPGVYGAIAAPQKQ